MEDLQIALNSARVEQRNQGMWIRDWHIGQTLQALVVDKSASRGTLLRIDGHQLVVPADIPAQKGAKLMLQVSHLMPAPTLKLLQVMNPVPAPIIHFAALSELSQKLTNQAKSLIPKQGKLNSALLSLFGVSFSEIPQIKVNLIESLRQIIPKTDNLDSAAQIAKALHKLGSFSGPEERRSNLKRLLSELAKDDSALPMEAPADLAEQTNAALAKIALNQIGSLRAQEQGEARYYLDLPLWFNGDLLVAELQIKRESEIDNERWQLWCQLNIPSIGDIAVQIYLDTARVSIVFSVQNEGFLRLLQEKLPVLEQQLRARGLEVSAIRCRRAKLSISSAMDQFANALDVQA